MSVYSDKDKGWRYDFILNGQRYSGAGYKTKRDARLAEAQRREEIEKKRELIGIDMVFFDLVSIRLDHVKAYNSDSHYHSYRCLAKKWVAQWGQKMCSEITTRMVQAYMLERRKVSPFTANKDLRYLRASFSYGKRKKLIAVDPTEGIEFFPEEKKIKYVPAPDDIDLVLAQADSDTQDYLWTIRETLGRMSEISNLTWDDVDLARRTVTLYTRKKRGGHRTPRRVPMTEKLFEILNRRFEARDQSKPWVFWHRYWSRKEGKFLEGPFGDRKRLMEKLCKKAGVRYFRFHALRHSGASLMDNHNVPIGAIQRILGHENRKTTEIYLHSMGRAERDAMAVFERVREKSHTESHTKEKGLETLISNP